jgi:hypothetical protein
MQSFGAFAVQATGFAGLSVSEMIQTGAAFDIK